MPVRAFDPFRGRRGFLSGPNFGKFTGDHVVLVEWVCTRPGLRTGAHLEMRDRSLGFQIPEHRDPDARNKQSKTNGISEETRRQQYNTRQQDDRPMGQRFGRIIPVRQRTAADWPAPCDLVSAPIRYPEPQSVQRFRASTIAQSDRHLYKQGDLNDRNQQKIQERVHLRYPLAYAGLWTCPRLSPT